MVVVGSVNLDTTVRVVRHPKPGETVAGDDGSERPGGKGANQAIAASRAGAGVGLVAAVGHDHAGDVCRRSLRAADVDLAAVSVIAGGVTGRAIVTVAADGENSIVVIAGANGLLTPDDVVDGIPHETSVVLVQLEIPLECAEAALRRARAIGARAILNASPVVAGSAPLLQLADVVIVNEHEHALLGRPAGACVTLGARGARWGDWDATPPPVAVVDTTGAGDAFAGTLAARIALGDDPRAALTAAVTAGALATTVLGAHGVSAT
ncbi:ribokinase [Microbacterium sp. cf046]|nr:ribokinase [Microbacterium sp. cf046]